jgi:hypothetical protein
MVTWLGFKPVKRSLRSDFALLNTFTKGTGFKRDVLEGLLLLHCIPPQR